MCFGIGKANTLPRRIARAYSVLFMAILVTLSAAVFLLAYRFLIQRQSEALLVSIELIADHVVEELNEGEDIVDRTILEEQNTNAALNLYLCDASGTLLSQVINFHLDFSALPAVDAAPKLHLSPENEWLLSCVEPVQDGDTRYGTLYAVLNLENEKDFLELLGALLLGADAVGLAAVLLTGWRMSRRVLRPIDSMIADARTIGSRSLDARLVVPEAEDELRSLALTVNGMLERLQAAFEAQGRFVADASHELRTPLAVLQGNVDMLSRWGKSDEKVLQDSIDSIQRQTGYMNKLVENLLFLAGSDGGRGTLHKSTFPVRALLDELLEEQALLDEAHIYRVHCAQDLSLYADRSMIRQLLRAILDNSVKYTPEGGEIALSASGDGQCVALAVQDTGIGMDEEHLAHIFERFYRVDKARARSTGGMGLGLSIAAAIVSAHGGRISADSRPGEGTIITAVFPQKEN